MTVPAHDPTTLINAARVWYDAGFCVIPSHEDGSKRPFGAWKQYQQQRPDWDKLHGWLSCGRYTGIGCIMGKASGNAEMIEIEGPAKEMALRLNAVIEHAKKYGDDSGVEKLLTDVVQGFLEVSAGGGLHTIIRISDGTALGNTKLAHDGEKVIAETRGEGGFVIVYPTPARTGHDPAAAYVLERGSPATVVQVTSDERDTLHQVFQFALDNPTTVTETPAPPATKAAAPSTKLSPFDDYRQRATWRDILEPAGWTWHSADSQHDYWVRPGKDPREGHSASTIEDGPFYLFSSSVEEMPREVGLSKAQVYAHLHHGGDLSAATRALREQGYGDDIQHREDLAPWKYDPDLADLTPADARAEYVRTHLAAIDWQQLWDDDTQEEWIVEPLIPARRLVALYSAPKVGKSLLSLELAAGIAAGRPLLGTPAQPPRTVLYVDFENDPVGDTRERLQAMNYTPQDLDHLKLLSFPTLAALDSAKGSEELMAAVECYGAEVVVIDTVSRAVKGDENENNTWLDFYRMTGLKLKAKGIALLRLDHTGKDQTKGQRGGSAKAGDVDAIWHMTKIDESTVQLRLDASRFAMPPEMKLLLLHRKEDPFRHEVDPNGPRAAFNIKVQMLVDEMDRLNLPTDWGRDRLTQALKDAKSEVPRGKASFGEAIKRRKSALKSLGQVVDAHEATA